MVPVFLTGLSVVADRYAAILCDVWGVLHNGVAPFQGAVDALARFRHAGGRVALVTNAPRPRASIERQLGVIGVSPECWDTIVSAGDVTVDLLRARGAPAAFHIGPDRDLRLFRDAGVARVAEDEAKVVVATGLVDDETERPEDYRPLLAGLAARGLPLVCANPDIVVERGDRLVWCAGALADLYAKLGGETILVGKPHAPIYAAAVRDLSRLVGRPLSGRDILAVGDGISTDIAGAARQGLDILFVTAGIHAADFGPPEAPDPEKVAARLRKEGVAATYALPRLVW